MGRKPSPSRLTDRDITEKDTPGLPAAMQDLALSADLEKNEILETGIDLGRIEALDFVATVANSAIIAIYEKVKKSKAWKNIRNLKSGDGRTFESLEEFCEVKLGKSYRRMRELLANRNLIGQEAFEQAEKIGLRQSDYSAIKALPAPKQEIIREALAEGADLETVTSALHRLIEEDQREIDTLTRKVEDIQANLDAQTRLLSDKNAKIDALDKALHKKKIQTVPPEEEGKQIRAEASQIAFAAEAEIRGNLRSAFRTLTEHAGKSNLSHSEFMTGLVCQIELALNQLRGEFLLNDKPDSDPTPAWMRPGAEEEVAKLTDAQRREAGWVQDENGHWHPGN